jgi:hypothetical protein
MLEGVLESAPTVVLELQRTGEQVSKLEGKRELELTLEQEVVQEQVQQQERLLELEQEREQKQEQGQWQEPGRIVPPQNGQNGGERENLSEAKLKLKQAELSFAQAQSQRQQQLQKWLMGLERVQVQKRMWVQAQKLARVQEQIQKLEPELARVRARAQRLDLEWKRAQAVAQMLAQVPLVLGWQLVQSWKRNRENVQDKLHKLWQNADTVYLSGELGVVEKPISDRQPGPVDHISIRPDMSAWLSQSISVVMTQVMETREDIYRALSELADGPNSLSISLNNNVSLSLKLLLQSCLIFSA